VRRLVAILALVLAACDVGTATFVVQRYPGAQRERYAVAVLRVNGSDTVRIAGLDREEINVPVQPDARLHFELLPGRHTVVVGTMNPGDLVERLDFDAEAGRVYRVIRGANGARIFAVDRDKDAPIADVTSLAVPPPAPPHASYVEP
jgi:hypothetical protein